jgi:hypothetical protein
MNNFVEFIAELKDFVLRVDDLKSEFTPEDSSLVLESVKGIAQAVHTEIERVFPNQVMDADSLAAVLDLETLLRRIKGEEVIRLQALEKFAQMTQGGVTA